MAYAFSPATEKKFEWLQTRYPSKQAVLIPLLHLVQREAGHLSVEAMDYVAGRMDISPGQVREVASFYTMFKFKPSGRYSLQICNSLSCYLRGSEQLLAKVKTLLGISPGETTPDGMFSVETAECLASCGTAPAMQVNEWDYHENLDEQKIEKIIGDLKSGRCAQESYDERKGQGSCA